MEGDRGRSDRNKLFEDTNGVLWVKRRGDNIGRRPPRAATGGAARSGSGRLETNKIFDFNRAPSTMRYGKKQCRVRDHEITLNCAFVAFTRWPGARAIGLRRRGTRDKLIINYRPRASDAAAVFARRDRYLAARLL
ncbi:hypothetical protein EVAR_27982_1 [Eumeta japonica]|uniref:Uncharacterized protein n=1 Tax=Eumeta variegata TaxID=151549 RepID=A0A4C1WB43_EUMVA|nr:hypothetical protein EVAR_27982_1 [Eumeta japonica]